MQVEKILKNKKFERFFPFGVAPIKKSPFLYTLTSIFQVYPIVVFILLFLNWIIFSGKFDIFHLGLGLVSSILVTWLSHDLLFHDRKMSLGQRVKQTFAFLRYIPWINKRHELFNYLFLPTVSVESLSDTQRGNILWFWISWSRC